jgi:hypothetical protein
MAAAGAVYCILWALRSADPRVGLLGALAVAATAAWLAREWTWHAAVQASCVFLLFHSVRWQKDAGPAATVLRFVTALWWMFDALVWTGNGTLAASGYVAGGATLVLAIWIWQLLRTGIIQPLITPAAAALTFATGPCNWFYSSAPTGIVALAGSVVLFAVGTLVAWYRNTLAGSEPFRGVRAPEN